MKSLNRLPRFSPIILIIVTCGLIVLGYFILSIYAAPSDVPTPATKPYVKLFSQGNGASSGDTDATAKTLAQYFSHIHGEGSDPTSFTIKKSGIGNKLLANGVWSSQYRNGSYVSQASGASDPLFSEASSLEMSSPLAIGTFWPGDYSAGNDDPDAGILTSGLDNTSTSIELNQATMRPRNTEQTWPFIASKDVNGDGYSNSTADYIVWIRVDNEIMQITSSPTLENDQIKLTLKRGIWGTASTSHAKGAKVLSPIYIGSTEMSGAPSQNNVNKALRYSIKFWIPQGYQWQADQILKTLGDGKTVAQGGKLVDYDTVWLDVSSCNQYNLADFLGNPVTNWDDLNNARMTTENWGKYQSWKLNGQNNSGGGLRDLVKHQNSAIKVKFTGNSMLKPGSSCDRNLLANVYDGGPLEGWMKGDFALTMKQSFDIQANDLPGIYWVRYDYGGAIPKNDPIAYKRYSYGSYLLSYNSSSSNPQFGMTWGFARPENLLFYNFGSANKTTSSLTDIAVSGKSNLYNREFSNGMVLVNAGSSDQTYNLAKDYYQVANDNTLSTINRVNGVITIKAKDSAFLLNPVTGTSTPTPSPSPTPTPTPKPTPSPTPTPTPTPKPTPSISPTPTLTTTPTSTPSHTPTPTPRPDNTKPTTITILNRWLGWDWQRGKYYIQLSWQTNGQTPQNYYVYVRDNKNNPVYSLLGVTQGSNKNLRQYNLKVNTSYTYAVFAVNGNGLGSNVVTTQATTQCFWWFCSIK